MDLISLGEQRDIGLCRVHVYWEMLYIKRRSCSGSKQLNSSRQCPSYCKFRF
jgi:hypothetical protein